MKTNQRGDLELVLTIIIVTIVVLLIGNTIGLSIYQAIATHRQETFTVNKSERIVDGGGKSSRYLIYTNKGVYQDADSFWNGKWNSSDLYNDIKVNKTYTCDVTGWRNGFFSWYPNVVRCDDAK